MSRNKALSSSCWIALGFVSVLAGCERAPAVGDDWRLATEADSRTRPCVRPPAPAEAADSLIIIDQPSEFPCEIVELPVSVVLKAESESSPDPSGIVVMTSNGRFVSNANSTSGQVLLWDRDGSFLGAYGSAGEGPGEFTMGGAHLLYTGPGDTLYVVDGRNRWSVFDQDMKYVRSFLGMHSGRSRTGTTVTAQGAILTTGRTLADRNENSIHLMDLQGELIRSFGGPHRVPLGRNVPVDRASGYGGGDTFWVSPVDESSGPMDLEEWTMDGRHIRTIRRNPPWLPEGGFPQRIDGIPLPQYRFLTVDEEGLLWIGTVVADMNWKEPLLQERETEDSQPIPETDPDLYRERFDLWIEVIDPDAGQVFASSRVDLFAGPGAPIRGNFRATRNFYRVISDDLGFNTIEVFEAALLAKDR